MRTLNCHCCGAPGPLTYGGHVHRGMQVLTAGWCGRCIVEQEHKRYEYTRCSTYPCGCLGGWHPAHGVDESSRDNGCVPALNRPAINELLHEAARNERKRKFLKT